MRWRVRVRVDRRRRAPPRAPDDASTHPSAAKTRSARDGARGDAVAPALAPLRRRRWRGGQLFFPDKRLIQFDCGKLQALAAAAAQAESGGTLLIFTQMTKMLDVSRRGSTSPATRTAALDGATKTEDRQKLMDRFNGSDEVCSRSSSRRARAASAST